ncbi:MAG: hypothetical protein ABF290_00710, partial [Thiogranum sp.]
MKPRCSCGECARPCGDKDNFATTMRAMNEAVSMAGGNWKYTEYPGVGHNSWERAYATGDLPA